MKNILRTKWILLLVPGFICLMNGCTCTCPQSRLEASYFSPHLTFMEPNDMQVADFLHLDTGQSLYGDASTWILPDLGDVYTKSFRDVQKEFEQLDWQVNQLINSLSDMIWEIDSHQKGRHQINRTKHETAHSTILDKTEMWIGSKGRNTLSGKAFEPIGGACNDVFELFENFGNPSRYHPWEGERASSTEHSSSATPTSPGPYPEDLQPSPSTSAETKYSAQADLRDVVSNYGSDLHFTPGLNSDFNMQGSMTTHGFSEDLSATQPLNSAGLQNTFSHFDVSSGSQISVATTPLVMSTSFSNMTRPSVEVVSSGAVIVSPTPGPATPVLNSASVVSSLRGSSAEGGVRSSQLDDTSKGAGSQISTDLIDSIHSTASSGTPIGYHSSWSVLESSTGQSGLHVSSSSVIVTSSSFSDVARSSAMSISSYKLYLTDVTKSSLITPSPFNDMTRTSSLPSSYTALTGTEMDTSTVASSHSASTRNVQSALSSGGDESSRQAPKSSWMLTSIFSSMTEPLATLFSSHEASTQSTVSATSSSASTLGLDANAWGSRQIDSSQMVAQIQSKTSSDNSRIPFSTMLPGDAQVTNLQTSSWLGSNSQSHTISATHQTTEKISFDTNLLFTASSETKFAPQIPSITSSGLSVESVSNSIATWTTAANVDSQSRSQGSSTGMDLATSTARSDIPSSAVQIVQGTHVTDVLISSPTSTSVTLRFSADVTTSESLMSSFGSTADGVASLSYRSFPPSLSQTTVPLASPTSSPTASYGLETLVTRSTETLSTSSVPESWSQSLSTSGPQQRATATEISTSQHATSSAFITAVEVSKTRNFEMTSSSDFVPSSPDSNQGVNKGAGTTGSQFVFVWILAVLLV